MGSCADDSCLSADTHRSVPAPFLTKTYQLVDDSATDEVVSWGSEMVTFVVWKPMEFARDLLPNYFKHNNFSSFVRQLNTYGFRKVVPNRWEFGNDNFKKGAQGLLCGIHRRKTAIPPMPSHALPPPMMPPCSETSCQQTHYLHPRLSPSSPGTALSLQSCGKPKELSTASPAAATPSTPTSSSPFSSSSPSFSVHPSLAAIPLVASVGEEGAGLSGPEMESEMVEEENERLQAENEMLRNEVHGMRRLYAEAMMLLQQQNTFLPMTRDLASWSAAAFWDQQQQQQASTSSHPNHSSLSDGIPHSSLPPSCVPIPMLGLYPSICATNGAAYASSSAISSSTILLPSHPTPHSSPPTSNSSPPRSHSSPPPPSDAPHCEKAAGGSAGERGASGEEWGLSQEVADQRKERERILEAAVADMKQKATSIAPSASHSAFAMPVGFRPVVPVAVMATPSGIPFINASGLMGASGMMSTSNIAMMGRGNRCGESTLLSCSTSRDSGSLQPSDDEGEGEGEDGGNAARGGKRPRTADLVGRLGSCWRPANEMRTSGSREVLLDERLMGSKRQKSSHDSGSVDGDASPSPEDQTSALIEPTSD